MTVAEDTCTGKTCARMLLSSHAEVVLSNIKDYRVPPSTRRGGTILFSGRPAVLELHRGLELYTAYLLLLWLRVTISGCGNSAYRRLHNDTFCWSSSTQRQLAVYENGRVTAARTRRDMRRHILEFFSTVIQALALRVAALT